MQQDASFFATSGKFFIFVYFYFIFLGKKSSENSVKLDLGFLAKTKVELNRKFRILFT